VVFVSRLRGFGNGGLDRTSESGLGEDLLVGWVGVEGDAGHSRLWRQLLAPDVLRLRLRRRSLGEGKSNDNPFDFEGALGAMFMDNDMVLFVDSMDSFSVDLDGFVISDDVGFSLDRSGCRFGDDVGMGARSGRN